MPPAAPNHEYELLEWFFITDLPGVYCDGISVKFIIWENDGQNRLSGSLPKLIGKLENLEYLYL